VWLNSYIGRSVVRESVRQGYKTIALVRNKEKTEESYAEFFQGAEVVQCDVTDAEALTATMKELSANDKIDGIVSCLASRSGIKK
jgi:divinyl chlorophyllide a 8-vinyl-reductase